MKKPLHIVYIGGSVTRGLYLNDPKEKFTAIVQEKLKIIPEYEGITYDNLGEAGTQSTHGLYLAATDIEKHNPDVVIVEYAINDTKENLMRIAFESLICRLLSLPSQPIVGILLSVNQEGYSCRGFMTAVGEHYGLPILDAGKQLQEEIQNGKMTWEDYSNDYGHPNKNGNEWLADRVSAWLINEVLPRRGSVGEFNMPEHFFGRDLMNLQILKKPWISTESKAIEVTFEGQYLFLLYIVDSTVDMGTAELVVDHNKELIQAYRIGSWRHEVPYIIHLKENRTHTLKLRMQSGESRKYFELVDMGFC